MKNILSKISHLLFHDENELQENTFFFPSTNSLDGANNIVVTKIIYSIEATVKTLDKELLSTMLNI